MSHNFYARSDKTKVCIPSSISNQKMSEWHKKRLDIRYLTCKVKSFVKINYIYVKKIVLWQTFQHINLKLVLECFTIVTDGNGLVC